VGRFDEQLKEFQTQFDATPEEEALPLNTPVIARLAEADMDMTQNGKLIIKEHWVIIEGEFEGQDVRVNQFPLASDFGTRKYKKWARVLGGFEDAPCMEMEEIVATISNSNVVAKLAFTKSKGGFVNHDVLENLGAGEVTEQPTASVAQDTTAAEPDDTSPTPPCPFAVGDKVTFESADGPEIGKVVGISLAYETINVETETSVFDDLPYDTVAAVDATALPADLVVLAESADIKPNTYTDLDGLVKLMNGLVWEEAALDPEEVATLTAHGVEVVAKPKPKAKKKARPKAKTKAKAKAKRK